MIGLTAGAEIDAGKGRLALLLQSRQKRAEMEESHPTATRGHTDAPAATTVATPGLPAVAL